MFTDNLLDGLKPDEARCKSLLDPETLEASHALRQRIADDLATEVSITTYGGRGWLRLSAQVYNRADEYDRLAERLPAYLAGLR